jgi:hypothetical protein
MHDIFTKSLLFYLDPGTGSLFAQLMAAGLLGSIGLIIKIYWRRIKAIFTRNNNVEEENTPSIKDEEK